MTTLRMTRGDGREYVVTILDSAGAAVDIATSTLTFTARRSYTGEIVITKTTGDGITATATTGQATLTIDPADTATLPDAMTDLLWDIEVTDSAGNPQTPLDGVLRIRPDFSTAEGS
jgi:hypothetical protein